MAAIRRSVVLNHKKTSVSLENEFWDALRAIAVSRNITLTSLVNEIDETRAGRNLSSAIRVFVLKQVGV
jgi:predicted DNA-binding ribbon-helix-helix protein